MELELFSSTIDFIINGEREREGDGWGRACEQ